MNQLLTRYRQRILDWIKTQYDKRQAKNQEMTMKDRVILFVICYVLALSLWFLVNLGRDYKLNLSLPITVVEFVDQVALAQPVTGEVRATIEGEGWAMLNIMNNRQPIALEVSGEPARELLDMSEIVRRELVGYSNLNVLKVEPEELAIEWEPRISRRIPVVPKLNLDFRNQYDLVGDILLEPDSILILGAKSKVMNYGFITTQTQTINGLKEDFTLTMEVQELDPLVEISPKTVRVRGQVAEYTEGELRVYVRSKNLPKGRSVVYSPQVITIKYDVPIDEYSAAQEAVPYSATVDYREIQSDSTGFISPTITLETPELHLKLRSFRPQRVSYYNVIDSK